MEFTKKKNLIDSFFLWCSVLVWQWHSYRVNHQAGTCCSTDPTSLTYNDRLPVFAYGPSRKKNFSRTHTHTHTHNRNVNSIIYLKKPFKKRTTKSILFENTPYYLLMKAPIRTALHDYQRHLITYKELFDIRLKRECFFFFLIRISYSRRFKNEHSEPIFYYYFFFVWISNSSNPNAIPSNCFIISIC